MSQPLYRRAYNAVELLRDHPPRFGHPHKSALFEIAYPDGVPASAEIEVTRWEEMSPQTVAMPEALSVVVQPNYYDYQPVAAAAPALEWHVNFADPRLFVAYGSPLFAQDEMQVAEHPVLASVREALLAEGLVAKTSDDTGPTPVLVRNAERRLEVATFPDASAGRPRGIYGNLFAAAPFDVIRRATRLVEPPTFSNIIAMAAPAGGYGEYSDAEIEFIFLTAYTAFAAARMETARAAGENAHTVIHTGFWGCGAFGGNRRLMIALQSLAARAAGIHQLALHTGDTAGAEEAEKGLDAATTLALRCGRQCTVSTIVERASLLGYRWGVSDGN